MKALIDGDILVYRSGFAAEKKRYSVYAKSDERRVAALFDNKKDLNAFLKEKDADDYYYRTGTLLEPIENALHSVKHTIAVICEAIKADSYQVYLTAEEGNFRDKVATIQPYKGNRHARRPFHYRDIRDYLVNVHNAIIIKGQEADDAMGIAQFHNFTTTKYGENDTCICTIDKDLDMIPGWHYNWVREERYFVDEEMAMQNFYRQLITGDSTDNIRGIAGAGPKAAKDLLEVSTNPLCDIGLLYAEQYDDPEAAMIETGRLLWIRRKENELWDFRR